MIGVKTGTLRRRLALAMMASAGLAVSIGLIGVTALYTLQEWLWRRTLPADVTAALEAAEHGEAPTPEILARVFRYAEVLERQSPVFDILGALVSASLGLACAVLLSLNLSRRLGAPIDAVSQAASAVAGGDLTARVPADADGPDEIRRLQCNFNQLVTSLSAAERELRETNAAIAHELRTPLTVLRLRLQAIVDGVTPPEIAELSKLIGQVDLLTRLVEDLRTLSLATAGRLELSRIPVDLADQVEGVAAAMRPTLDRAGVELSFDLRPTPAVVDPLRVQQCVQALLSNVAPHASCGGQA
jgi:two-component system, OmpR family, sensor histidine kinase AdeS